MSAAQGPTKATSTRLPLPSGRYALGFPAVGSLHVLIERPTQIFTTKVPFFHIENDLAFLMRVVDGERPTKPTGCENIGFTKQLWSLMQQGWAKQPDSRPPLSAFIEVLEV
jgi:hypothetical protein